MKHFATITLVLFLLICVVFVECRDSDKLTIAQVTQLDARMLKGDTPRMVSSENPFFEVGGEAYVLPTDDTEIVFRYNRNNHQWELVALFH